MAANKDTTTNTNAFPKANELMSFQWKYKNKYIFIDCVTVSLFVYVKKYDEKEQQILQHIYELNKLASSKMRKWKSSQSEKIARWQDNKTTRWQDDKMTRWQGDKVTRWQDDKITCKELPKVAESGWNAKTGKKWTKCQKLTKDAKTYQILPKVAKSG